MLNKVRNITSDDDFINITLPGWYRISTDNGITNAPSGIMPVYGDICLVLSWDINTVHYLYFSTRAGFKCFRGTKSDNSLTWSQVQFVS